MNPFIGNLSDEKVIDSLASEKLGRYVYALFDPVGMVPFYVGKAGGSDGKGNKRVLDHFAEAREPRCRGRKVDKIRKIWERRQHVEWRIVRSGIESERVAFEIESAVIDGFQAAGFDLLNQQSGHGSSSHGLKGPEDLRVWCAPTLSFSSVPVEFRDRPVFVFNIAKGLTEWLSRGETKSCALLKATCREWKVSAHFRSLEGGIAVGCINGTARTAFAINGWMQNDTRWIIEAFHQAKIEKVFNLKSFSPVIDHCKGYWQRGNYLVFSIGSDDQATVLRGSEDPKIATGAQD